MIMMLLVVTILVFENSSKASAAVKSSKSKETYINTTDANLYLGEDGQDYFDFNIKKTFKNKIKTYAWSVKTEKGDPETVKLDKKTGIVMAKKPGISYINCKITLTNGKALNSEAKVTVHNNIKEVVISNIPNNNRIIMGGKTDFNSEIINTAAGKNVPTQGIIRWEITADTADVISVTDEGVVEPAKEGSFKIRAICFESIAKYNLWLSDKKSYSSYITASSEWATIKVIYMSSQATNNSQAIATNQEELNKLLAENGVNEIAISTQEALTIKIPEGYYNTKTLIVDTKNAEIINYGVFKNISIIEVKDNSWREYAKGNSFNLKSSNSIKFIVENYAEVTDVIIETAGCYLSLENNGSVKRIRLLKSSQLHVSGKKSKISVDVESTVVESTISTSVPLNLRMNATTYVTLDPGAEKTDLTKVSKSVILKITNNTTESVVLTTYMWLDNTINAGSVCISPSYDDSELNNMNLPVAASIMVFANGIPYNVYSGEIRIFEDTIIDQIVIRMSEGVELVMTPKDPKKKDDLEGPSARILTTQWSAKFGDVLINDDKMKDIVIVPMEKINIFDKVGTFNIVIPNGSLKDQDGNTNAKITIKIIVSEAEDNN